ncbi:ATPase [Natronoflexus pectinivorans]|uniref:N-acetylglucosamine kinase-like BadF-type ATPase n=1 Tax=Natronoflexus pectinivorans TaxID=682526 RepID=A0A4R2GL11_9BACT|nr:ATPase [Natronoflexus pectinivorans]TCO08926.1 N-acetylglucosamine kinase-like BadF-type ATPase [Natronoflexus pectinivorans]
MIIIADSGSTNTTWAILTSKYDISTFHSPGINPFFQDKSQIVEILKEHCKEIGGSITKIYFYGAGCANAEKSMIVEDAIKEVWNPEKVEVNSDLLAAARSLCGCQEGIVGILGTGSNSCYYNGSEIEAHVSPLGFILGDEGSGAVLGKTLIADVLKKQLPDHICKQFNETYHLSPAEILDKVYKQPFPNRFLADFTKFLYNHQEEESIKTLLKESFEKFFKRNIDQYHVNKTLPVHFTGSVAWYFQDILKESAMISGYVIGKIVKEPINGLIEYHKNEN